MLSRPATSLLSKNDVICIPSSSYIAGFLPPQPAPSSGPVAAALPQDSPLTAYVSAAPAPAHPASHDLLQLQGPVATFSHGLSIPFPALPPPPPSDSSLVSPVLQEAPVTGYVFSAPAPAQPADQEQFQLDARSAPFIPVASQQSATPSSERELMTRTAPAPAQPVSVRESLQPAAPIFIPRTAISAPPLQPPSSGYCPVSTAAGCLEPSPASLPQQISSSGYAINYAAPSEPLQNAQTEGTYVADYVSSVVENTNYVPNTYTPPPSSSPIYLAMSPVGPDQYEC